LAVLARKSSFQSIGRDERGVTTRTRAGPGFDVRTDGDEVDGDISGRTLCVMDVRVASGGASVDGRGCLFLGLVENFERVSATKVGPNPLLILIGSRGIIGWYFYSVYP
jgi:hypothetical protein